MTPTAAGNIASKDAAMLDTAGAKDLGHHMSCL
jgi:hypothetical protein